MSFKWVPRYLFLDVRWYPTQASLLKNVKISFRVSNPIHLIVMCRWSPGTRKTVSPLSPRDSVLLNPSCQAGSWSPLIVAPVFHLMFFLQDLWYFYCLNLHLLSWMTRCLLFPTTSYNDLLLILAGLIIFMLIWKHRVELLLWIFLNVICLEWGSSKWKSRFWLWNPRAESIRLIQQSFGVSKGAHEDFIMVHAFLGVHIQSPDIAEPQESWHLLQNWNCWFRDPQT